MALANVAVALIGGRGIVLIDWFKWDALLLLVVVSRTLRFVAHERSGLKHG